MDEDKGIFISEAIHSLTIASAQNSKQFSLIKKEKGEEYLQVAISKIMKEAFRFLPSKMNEEDIIYFAKYFQKEFWYWKFDDFILCFKNGIEKKYGEIFGEFNISVFMSWAEKYNQEKEDFFYNKHLSSVEKNNSNEENKHKIFKERQGKTNEPVTLKNYFPEGQIPDENYFKK